MNTYARGVFWVQKQGFTKVIKFSFGTLFGLLVVGLLTLSDYAFGARPLPLDNPSTLVDAKGYKPPQQQSPSNAESTTSAACNPLNN